LLSLLQAIENQQGRVRGATRWGPRTLDLDILIYGQAQIKAPELTVPHPGIAERPFVLYPLAEIAPDLKIPGCGALQELLDRCPPKGLERLAPEGLIERHD
ncbi:MAG TPA: 2-amino-4-hydroxy-6-hydroxymethyldihydropteridine diphosphokinase, partial [Gammaproteobacteria bacterium]|nr:2-amino-4-hydroxy-6-hydroxymethyldihydropteridine diphosphokinase [Gammaproteobacteria bacterium]